MINEVFGFLNAAAWIFSNVLVAYIAVVLVVFVILYYIWFDPKATTGGKFIFRFIFSLIGVIGLVFIGLFIDPQMGRRWFEYPDDVLWFRPFLRVAAYGFVAYTVTGLAVLLTVRKFWPNKLRTATDKDIVKVRNNKYEK